MSLQGSKLSSLTLLCSKSLGGYIITWPVPGHIYTWLLWHNNCQCEHFWKRGGVRKNPWSKDVMVLMVKLICQEMRCNKIYCTHNFADNQWHHLFIFSTVQISPLRTWVQTSYMLFPANIYCSVGSLRATYWYKMKPYFRCDNRLYDSGSMIT